MAKLQRQSSFTPVMSAAVPKGFYKKEDPRWLQENLKTVAADEKKAKDDMQAATMASSMFGVFWSRLQQTVGGAAPSTTHFGASMPIAASQRLANADADDGYDDDPEASGLLGGASPAIAIRQLLLASDPGTRAEATIAELESLVAKHEFFRELPAFAVRHLLQWARAEKLAPKQRLFVEGGPGGVMYIVTLGGVEVRKRRVKGGTAEDGKAMLAFTPASLITPRESIPTAVADAAPSSRAGSAPHDSRSALDDSTAAVDAAAARRGSGLDDGLTLAMPAATWPDDGFDPSTVSLLAGSSSELELAASSSSFTMPWEDKVEEDELVQKYGRRLEVITAGHSLDEMALLKAEPRQVTALASRTTGAQLLAVDKAAFEAMLLLPGNVLFVPRRYKDVLRVPPSDRTASQAALIREMLTSTKHAYFQDVPTALAAELAHAIKLTAVPPRSEAVLLREGQQPEAVTLLLKGRVDVYRRRALPPPEGGDANPSPGGSTAGPSLHRRGSVVTTSGAQAVHALRRGSVAVAAAHLDAVGTGHHPAAWAPATTTAGVDAPPTLARQASMHHTQASSVGEGDPGAMSAPTLTRRASMAAQYGDVYGVLQPGDSFGERVVLSGAPAHSTYVACPGSELLHIPRLLFARLAAAVGPEVVDACDVARVLRTPPGARSPEQVDALELLTKGNVFLAGLPPRVRRLVLQRSFHQRVGRDETIFVEGQKGDRFYIVLRGQVGMHERPKAPPPPVQVPGDVSTPRGGGTADTAPPGRPAPTAAARLIGGPSMRNPPSRATPSSIAGGPSGVMGRPGGVGTPRAATSPSLAAAIPEAKKERDPAAVMLERYGPRIMTVAAGGSFGEIALLDNAGRSATVIARGATELLVVTKDDYMATLREVQAQDAAEKVAFLATVGPLSRWPSARLHKLWLSLHVHTYDRGAVIIDQGAPPSDWYIVRSGAVTLSARLKVCPTRPSHVPADADWRGTVGYTWLDVPLGVLGPGDHFGAWALLVGGSHPVSARITSSAAELYVLKGADLARALGDDAAVADARASATAQRAWEVTRLEAALAARHLEAAPMAAPRKGARVQGHGPVAGSLPKMASPAPAVDSGATAPTMPVSGLTLTAAAADAASLRFGPPLVRFRAASVHAPAGDGGSSLPGAGGHHHPVTGHPQTMGDPVPLAPSPLAEAALGDGKTRRPRKPRGSQASTSPFVADTVRLAERVSWTHAGDLGSLLADGDHGVSHVTWRVHGATWSGGGGDSGPASQFFYADDDGAASGLPTARAHRHTAGADGDTAAASAAALDRALASGPRSRTVAGPVATAGGPSPRTGRKPVNLPNVERYAPRSNLSRSGGGILSGGVGPEPVTITLGASGVLPTGRASHPAMFAGGASRGGAGGGVFVPPAIVTAAATWGSGTPAGVSRTWEAADSQLWGGQQGDPMPVPRFVTLKGAPPPRDEVDIPADRFGPIKVKLAHVHYAPLQVP